MKDKTTPVPASQVCERVCVCVCVCVSVILRNCAERWRTKLQLYLPARCVSMCVCVFQSFSETVQRDEGQNYSCTCQPGVWACVCVCFSHSQKLCREMKDKTTAVPASQVCERVCVSVILRNCAERWRTKLQLYLPARCVSVCVCVCVCVCVSVILRNCAERWRTKLHLYLPARCVNVCVFQSFSETVPRDEGQNYSCTCQPGVWACVCVCFSHSQKLCREMKDKTTAVPASQVCECVCVSQSFSETVQRDEGQNYSCTCQPGVWAFQSFSETVCLLAQLLWWRLQGFDLSCIICVLTGISHLHTYIHRWSTVFTIRLNGKNKPFKYIYFFFYLKHQALIFILFFPLLFNSSLWWLLKFRL